MNPAGTDNAQEMLRKAELALAGGNFMRANRISKDTSGLLEQTRTLHRKFIKKMKKFIDRIMDMEERGYDISEAMDIMGRAKERAMKADYNKALKTMNLVNPALERAAYMPFPLLNKTVDIISTIFFSNGKVIYTVRIENPTEEPLGEIIITPSFPEDDFYEVPEKPYGIVGGREFKEFTFYLSPKEGKEWNLGIGREILMEEGVTMRTKLSSKKGNAQYLVVVENNNDQVIRDLVVSPQTPGGLVSEPSHGVIEKIDPFSTGSVTFELYPAIINPRNRGRSNERVVVIEDEEPYHPRSDDEFEITEENEIIDDEEEDELDQDPIDEDLTEGPQDFTPVKEEYNLIEMAPSRYPEEVERGMKKKQKKKRKKMR